ncbi:hypothetical protein, partial [Aeromonas dhakensis]|uniref:hypothetical protein n=1 Tax=Aeromonas dhakensis TaxID=196024 RepID=UPI003B9E4B49
HAPAVSSVPEGKLALIAASCSEEQTCSPSAHVPKLIPCSNSVDIDALTFHASDFVLTITFSPLKKHIGG